ncbi:MAG TPA: hypothetical protein VLB46_11900 [Pyrinomonadaceae bacterium]|nr:hypothetical protein [Pyrinomonadaceae bacterium]
MKFLLFITMALLLFSESCGKSTPPQAGLDRLDIYSGYVAGVDEVGYQHAVDTFTDEMERQAVHFASAEIRIIRYGDRNSVRAVPVLKLRMPQRPDCHVRGAIFKQGKAVRDQQCRDSQQRFSQEFNERVGQIRLALKAAPQSSECVSYKNLLTRLRFEPDRPTTVVITDVSHACPEREQLEPLQPGTAPLVVIQVATDSGFAQLNEYVEWLLTPGKIVPGTSAEHAVNALTRMDERLSQR